MTAALDAVSSGKDEALRGFFRTLGQETVRTDKPTVRINTIVTDTFRIAFNAAKFELQIQLLRNNDLSPLWPESL
jgi:hypothetical protein